MASVLRFQDMTPSLTPPPSDRGECEDTAMLVSENYLPEVFYPSPAPSFSHQRLAFARQSPDMGRSDSTYDTEEDNQPLFFLNSPEPQVFANTTPLQYPSLYSTSLSYPSFESNPWLSYNSYPNTASMFPPYAGEGTSGEYPGYVLQVPSSIPPVPQGVTGHSFSFNRPISGPHDTHDFIRGIPTRNLRQHSPQAPTATSVCGMSSRSHSPSLSLRAAGETDESRRSSMMGQRSSSSSLNAFGIPIRTPDSITIQAWKCAYPNCASRAVFTRGCDLRKHYNRHSKHLFCRVDGCPQSEAACIVVAQQQVIQTGSELSDPSNLAVTGGFSSKKDRTRHEAKHNPGIKCEWSGSSGEECGRLFSRMDNMKDHVRRIHNKGHPQLQEQQLLNRKKSVE